MRALAALVAVIAAIPAFAQSGPSFDCAKASNAAERAICAKPELATADREMASVYGALAAKLSGPAKEHLEKDQARWVANRDKACAGGDGEIARCLVQRYAARTNNLRAFDEGLYPFVGAQALIKSGKVGKISWAIDASWPQFDGTTADFASLNRSYAERAGKAGDEVIPTSTADGEMRGEQLWSYDQSFELQRPSANAIAVAIRSHGFAGGAHGFGGTDAQLIDLRTGHAAGPVEVFGHGDAWLDVLVPLVRLDLRKQFSDNRPGFDDAVTPANLTKLLREPAHYYYRRDRLQLIFNAYLVGPYVSGPFAVNIPYGTLQPLFAADGPMGR
jgi:uncharacterized protein